MEPHESGGSVLRRRLRQRPVVLVAVALLVPRAVAVWLPERGPLAIVSFVLGLIGCVLLALAVSSASWGRLAGLSTRLMVLGSFASFALVVAGIVLSDIQPAAPTRALIAFILFARLLLIGTILLGALLTFRFATLLFDRAS